MLELYDTIELFLFIFYFIHLRGVDLFAKAESNDMYASIDKLINKLDSQILRHKEKLHSHRG